MLTELWWIRKEATHMCITKKRASSAPAICLIIIFRCYNRTSLSFACNPLLKNSNKMYFISSRRVFSAISSLLDSIYSKEPFPIALFKYRISAHNFSRAEFVAKIQLQTKIFNSCYVDCFHKK